MPPAKPTDSPYLGVTMKQIGTQVLVNANDIKKRNLFHTGIQTMKDFHLEVLLAPVTVADLATAQVQANKAALIATNAVAIAVAAGPAINPIIRGYDTVKLYTLEQPPIGGPLLPLFTHEVYV